MVSPLCPVMPMVSAIIPSSMRTGLLFVDVAHTSWQRSANVLIAMSMSPYIQFLRSLRAVRTLRPTPLPQETIDEIVEVGRWSGSASNQQPTEIVVVRDRQTIE